MKRAQARSMSSQRGASVISLLVAVCIASIAYVAYYKVMFHFQKSEQPRMEKIQLQQTLVSELEELQYQLHLNQLDPLVWMVYKDELGFFEERESEESDEGMVIAWSIGDQYLELSQIVDQWYRLRAKAHVEDSSYVELVWRADAP